MTGPLKTVTRGCSIIFYNKREEILLLLRDDIPTIPYPGMWDLPGGHLEPGEAPFDCIVREMKEEMGIALTGHRFFARTVFSDRIEYTFVQSANFQTTDIDLTEGQRIAWFSEKKAQATSLAYGFNLIVRRFFSERV